VPYVLTAVELDATESLVSVVDARVVGRDGTPGAAEGSVSDGAVDRAVDVGAEAEAALDRAVAVLIRSQGFGGDGIVFAPSD
jgi:hypothetical protein